MSKTANEKETIKGFQRFNSGASPYNAMQFMIERAMQGKIHTATPCKVVAVDGGYVDVLPLVSTIDGKGEAVEPTTLYKLPYMRIHGGVAALICDPIIGDIGLAVFAQSDSTNVKQGTTEPQQVASFRRFSMADGFYLGGFLNQPPSVFVEIRQDNTVNIQAATVNISGDAIIGGISFLGHTHTGVHGETSPPH